MGLLKDLFSNNTSELKIGDRVRVKYRGQEGYIIDKKRMENGAFIDEDYFEHLLSEIREIRMSERRFYQKLKDIYATSIDYNRDAPTTRMFYKKMQNKMHFAVQGLMPLY